MPTLRRRPAASAPSPPSAAAARVKAERRPLKEKAPSAGVSGSLEPPGKKARTAPREKMPPAQREALENHDAAMEKVKKQYRAAARDLDKEGAPDAIKGLSKAEVEKLVADVTRFCLFKHHSTGGVPIARADLSDVVNQAGYAKTLGGKKGALANYVVVRAQARLADVFGFELREVVRAAKGQSAAAAVPKPKPQKGKEDGAATAAAPTGTRFYVLRSILPTQLRAVVGRHAKDAKAQARRGFAITVCGLVRAAERLTEEALWSHLETLGVSRGGAPHPDLGDAEAEVAKLVKMRYLTRERQPNAGPAGEDVYVYELAEVALAEIEADGIDGFLADIAAAGAGPSSAAAAEEHEEEDDGDGSE